MCGERRSGCGGVGVSYGGEGGWAGGGGGGGGVEGGDGWGGRCFHRSKEQFPPGTPKSGVLDPIWGVLARI